MAAMCMTKSIISALISRSEQIETWSQILDPYFGGLGGQIYHFEITMYMAAILKFKMAAKFTTKCVFSAISSLKVQIET